LAMMAISRWLIVTSDADCTEDTMFCLLLWSSWKTSYLCQYHRSGHPQMLIRSPRCFVSGCMEHCAG
jgi:hypothetical protein